LLEHEIHFPRPLLFVSAATTAENQVYFSPRGGCTEAVVENLNKATNSVLVQAYSFTSTPIARALVNAHQRGVKVEVILDRGQPITMPKALMMAPVISGANIGGAARK